MTGSRMRAATKIALIAGSVVCIAAALAMAANIGWFLRTSSVRGGALVLHERQAISAAAQNARTCQGSVGDAGRALASGGNPAGLLEIPALGLVAPVLQGTDEKVLSDAVGHVPGSVWPGQQGTTVLSAHDVTWFSRIDGLKTGAQVRYVTPCRTFVYLVTGHQVVRAGSPVYNTSAGRIVLDTCYPLNALYITPLRYLVYAGLAQTAPTAPVRAPAVPAPLTVPVPAALAAQGLSLQQNYAPLGTLTLAGAPSAAWRQTNAPLQDEATALTAYFGILRSAEQGERGWWARLAPGVPVSAAADLSGGQISGYVSRLRITLLAQGSQATGATLAATVTVTGSSRPGTYDLTVDEAVTGQHRLVVSGFTLRNR
jgi:sortase A